MDAERAVLGACLMATPPYDPVADAVRILWDGDLYEFAHEMVWSAVVRLHGASRPRTSPRTARVPATAVTAGSVTT
ncbi:hypothetical protein [Streptomyces sp. DH24]|uniref:hypothetical protein n=1 Tax=Streptomyces sp. DH24 TaxID=3040123 RepID=UPI00244143C7|nr:hypothetical protein [Streptomyces sp. DH24]MDG9721015.1 hypothetical protein [Streptomyces sp. DH24]